MSPDNFLNGPSKMKRPQTIGRYEILEEIGRGAMGLVYLAHDPKIDRKVAIKTIQVSSALPPDEAEEMRKRFAREAQAAGRLQHPGIVTIFDVGEHEGGSFIAMEYIEGETLEKHTKKGSLLQAASALDLIAQACDALDYAHQNNVVHRDIKPANLMLVKGSRLKITDFGLAKDPATNLTQDGILIGTPNYMSPEQVTGSHLDGRSDLFSLAAVLYEMLTGERPFSGDSVTTIIYRIIHETPPPPHQRNPLIPSAAGHLLARGLAKDPGQRYRTGAEFAAELRQQQSAWAGAETKWISEAGSAGASPRPDAKRSVSRSVAEARGGTLRGIVTAAATLAFVLLLPAQTTESDAWGRAVESGATPFYATAAILAGGAPPAMPAVAVPGGGPSMLVTFLTEPPGGTIWVDDLEAPGGLARVPLDDESGTVTVVAENDCFIDEIEFRPGDADSVTIPLKTPKVERVAVTSRPSGARIALDGRDTGLTTPAELSLAACESHRVALARSGYKDVERSLEGRDGALDVTLPPIPDGFVRIAAPYPVEITEGGKRLGEGGSSIKLTSGRHTLRIRNEDLFVDRTIEVEIPENSTVAPEANLPGLGRLTVLASPSNCDIFINDRGAGAPPIIDHPVAAGTYRVRAVYLPTGEAKESTITVTAGSGARVPFKFNP